MRMDSFLTEVAAFPRGELLFNPYRDHDARFDVADAVAIRTRNATNYFRAFDSSPEILLLGEAPGPWGARFSGVAFTSESQFLAGYAPTMPFQGQRSSTLPEAADEMSARQVWSIVHRVWPRVIQWNTVPFLPYQSKANPLSIRSPKASEVQACLPLLEAFLGRVRPRRVLAVGRHAEAALGALDVTCEYVRHPSRGGATVFKDTLTSILGLPQVRQATL